MEALEAAGRQRGEDTALMQGQVRQMVASHPAMRSHEAGGGTESTCPRGRQGRAGNSSSDEGQRSSTGYDASSMLAGRVKEIGVPMWRKWLLSPATRQSGAGCDSMSSTRCSCNGSQCSPWCHSNVQHSCRADAPD